MALEQYKGAEISGHVVNMYSEYIPLTQQGTEHRKYS